MIGTGNVGGSLGPALGAAGYEVIYGSRSPDRPDVQALVARSGPGARATSALEAAAAADVVVLAIPGEALEETTAGMGDLSGKILVEMSGSPKRMGDDGYLDLATDVTNAQLLQRQHPDARVVRISIPISLLFEDPTLLGTRPTILMAADDPEAKEVVGQAIFDVGIDVFDAGPLRYALYMEAMSLVLLVPDQQGRAVTPHGVSVIGSSALSCFLGTGALTEADPYDREELAQLPQRSPPRSCQEWALLLGFQGGN
jgi:predicted dinucleotide-binding enzyme